MSRRSTHTVLSVSNSRQTVHYGEKSPSLPKSIKDRSRSVLKTEVDVVDSPAEKVMTPRKGFDPNSIRIVPKRRTQDEQVLININLN